MKRKWIAATAVACALTASISLCSLPALGEPLSIGKDTTVVSTLKDATGNKILDSDAVSLIPENTTYHCRDLELNLILTNLSTQPLTFIKEGRLEMVEKERWIVMSTLQPIPARLSPFRVVSDSHPEGFFTVQPGESLNFLMRLLPYAPLTEQKKSLFSTKTDEVHRFAPGEYRAVITLQRPDGTEFEWGSKTFRFAESDALADPDIVTMQTTHTAYDGTAKAIQLSIENQGTGTLFYGCPYLLQRQDGGSWVTVKARASVGWSDTESDLPPGELRSDTVHLGAYANLSPGVYRIVKELGNYVAAANFTVSNPGLAPKLPNAVSMEIFWPDKISGGKTYQFTEADVYEEQPAPQGILHELLAFQSCVTPLNISKEDAVEIKLINKGGQSVTANLIGNSRTSYIQVGSNWYSTEDSGVLSRIKALIDGV